MNYMFLKASNHEPNLPRRWGLDKGGNMIYLVMKILGTLLVAFPLKYALDMGDWAFASLVLGIYLLSVSLKEIE